MDEQHFCPDNSGYAEKRVQSYYFFLYLANFQSLSFFFLADLTLFLSCQRLFPQISRISQIYFVSLQPISFTELSHVVQERAESPKAPEAARPERAEAPSPGHRPGYSSSQQVAL